MISESISSSFLAINFCLMESFNSETVLAERTNLNLLLKLLSSSLYTSMKYVWDGMDCINNLYNISYHQIIYHITN